MPLSPCVSNRRERGSVSQVFTRVLGLKTNPYFTHSTGRKIAMTFPGCSPFVQRYFRDLFGKPYHLTAG